MLGVTKSQNRRRLTGQASFALLNTASFGDDEMFSPTFFSMGA
jgi:hypothetical protein